MAGWGGQYNVLEEKITNKAEKRLSIREGLYDCWTEFKHLGKLGMRLIFQLPS